MRCKKHQAWVQTIEPMNAKQVIENGPSSGEVWNMKETPVKQQLKYRMVSFITSREWNMFLTCNNGTSKG